MAGEGSGVGRKGTHDICHQSILWIGLSHQKLDGREHRRKVHGRLPVSLCMPCVDETERCFLCCMVVQEVCVRVSVW